MFRLMIACAIAGLLPVAAASAQSRELVQLAADATLSPNGKRLVFSYAGDLWTVPTKGGTAQQLTQHPGDDRQPVFSPDGKRIAFVSSRENGSQIYTMSTGGSAPEQLTVHSEGYSLQQWSAEDRLLALSTRDHYWRHAERFFSVPLNEQVNAQPEELLFDAYGHDGRLSPDGKHLLFVRESTKWYRKGYEGSQAGQIWKYDLSKKTFQQILAAPGGCRHPLWKPDGSGFYYVLGKDGNFNLHAWDFNSKTSKPLTTYHDDAVLEPCLSRDGSTIVFRRLFDLYRLRPDSGKPARKINITLANDRDRQQLIRRKLTTANNAAISRDGLEIAFAAGGDLWVMDADLREPVPVTSDAYDDTEPVWSADNKRLFFLREIDGNVDLWQATRSDDKNYWWRNTSFDLKPVMKTAATETNIQLSPNGKQIAFAREPGELWIANLDGKSARKLVNGFDIPSYDFSPDGRWIVYANSDDDFNREIWIVPTDGSKPAVNISRHPDNDYSPVWSPDGKKIAFIGRRAATETDIYYVYLQVADEQQSARDKKLKAALEKFKKARPQPKPPVKPAAKPATDPAKKPVKPAADEGAGEKKDADKKAAEKKEEKPTPKVVKPALKIDFDGIHKRLHRISIPNATENQLFWFGDGKTLAFAARINGKSGTYTVEVPGRSTPTLLTTKVVQLPHRLKDSRKVGCLIDSKPAILNLSGGAIQSFSVSALQELNRDEWYTAGFNAAWRLMRDNWYDEKFNNRDWEAIRKKYETAASLAPDHATLKIVVELMLGELNGSHLGFYPSSSTSSRTAWKPETPHFGLRFIKDFKGPGLKVRDVLPEGPADREQSRISPGEIVLEIDGTAVSNSMNLTRLLNGRLDRTIRLKVEGKDGKKRDVLLRPISYSAARELLYQQWIETNRQKVASLSKNKFGYLHIRAMNSASFLEFERELYNVGYQKEGLVIDVRENGGGSTTDHLLTALTQPRHAVTVPRGGGPGYPQDRTIYAVWEKPIVVLCNQNSFSNAEIFSHAIKNLERGRVVGVTTAGGVISTGIARVMDIGMLRQPFRGWYVKSTGQDMELNGAVPHFEIWPQPGELPAGVDRQLQKAVGVLAEDVAKFRALPKPELKNASSGK